VDENGRPARDQFMIDIYIMDDNLHFKHVVIGHRQLRSTGVGTSRREALIYFIEETDQDYGLYGKIITAPWIAPVIIPDLIMRDLVHGETEVDKICGHLTRICLPSAITIEFKGVNQFIPNSSVFDPNTP